MQSTEPQSSRFVLPVLLVNMVNDFFNDHKNDKSMTTTAYIVCVTSSGGKHSI